MERFFLIIILFGLSACQIPNLIRADRYIEPVPLEITKPSNNYENIWDRIRGGSLGKGALPDIETQKYIDSYLSNPSQLNKLLEKGRYFIFFVLDELDRYNLPPELALLPYIESNYDPFSISSSGAMGIWQFMPATARIYGLKDTWWNEQRHDPLISSKAAVRYLAYLHNRFNNDITYTLAAYNGGPTLLEKQIKLNRKLGKSLAYKDLKLPSQTKEYVPKFQAIREIVINAEKYGIKLPNFPNKKVLGKVELDGQVEIFAFSEFVQLKPEFIYKLLSLIHI